MNLDSPGGGGRGEGPGGRPSPIGPTAGLIWSGSHAYFMRGREYLEYDLAADQVDPGYPATIEGRWPDWPAGFEPTAAINWGNGAAYIFSSSHSRARRSL